ncbi:MAG: hypothetical protein ACRDXB_07650, partial [Actinomycetes bacterium]
AQLRRTYEGLFAGRRGARRAATLVEHGGIAAVLDGLDEIAEGLRSDALEALGAQAGFRIVVLSRSAEIADAARSARLLGAAAVELQDIAPGDAADYVERIEPDRIPDRWQDLVTQLRAEPEGALARALSNPLTLTLVRDVYRDADSIGDFLDFCADADDPSRDDVEDYLLDRLVPHSYRRRPGHPLRYDEATASATLRLIARRLTGDGTLDLSWWRIPTWTPVLPRVLIIGVVGGLVGGIGLGAAAWTGVTDLYRSSASAIGLGIAFGVWSAGVQWRNPPTRWRYLFGHPFLTFLVGLALGYALLFTLLLSPIGAVAADVFGYAVVVWVVLVVLGLALRLDGRRRGHHPPQTRSGRITALLVGLASGYVGATVLMALSGPWFFVATLVVGVFVLALGLVFGLGRMGRGSMDALAPYASWAQHRVVA